MEDTLQQPVQTDLHQPDLFRNTIGNGHIVPVEWRDHNTRAPGNMHFIRLFAGHPNPSLVKKGKDAYFTGHEV